MCLCVYMSLSECLRVCASACACVCIYVYISVYMCDCLRVYVCVRVEGGDVVIKNEIICCDARYIYNIYSVQCCTCQTLATGVYL